MIKELWQEVESGLDPATYNLEYLDGQRAKLQDLASRFQDVEWIHLNSTGAGGGVAEILTGLLPLAEWHGINTRWLVIPPSPAFFQVTRKVHDLLQGAPGDLSPSEWEIYLSHLRDVGTALPRDERPRIWFIHDHQLLPLVELLPPNQTKVWVSHVDTSHPNPAMMQRLLPFIAQYDRLVFSLNDYVPAEMDGNVSICPPAIDPLRLKNQLITEDEARQLVAQFGIDTERPLLAQISRFDPWKDPTGVIDAYRLVKREMPSVQLALVGALSAIDDPKALETLNELRQYAGDDPDLHLYWDASVIDDAFVRAFQTAPEIVIQKSTREGFGLTVTEAMWKRKAVIGGNVGGIVLQIQDGETGFLVSSVEECAERSLDLLSDPARRLRMGNAAHDWVREHSLLPRLMHDYLQLLV